MSKGSGQSFGFDTFSPLVLERNFEGGKGGYPMQHAFKDMGTFEEVLRERLGADMPSVTQATMLTYKKVYHLPAIFVVLLFSLFLWSDTPVTGTGQWLWDGAQRGNGKGVGECSWRACEEERNLNMKTLTQHSSPFSHPYYFLLR